MPSSEKVGNVSGGRYEQIVERLREELRSCRRVRSSSAMAHWKWSRCRSSNTERDHALAPWLTFYNTRRRHTTLAGQT
ncbi:hypothetical protein ACWC0C_48180 [Streptomyces sp. NPDC001709]